MESQPSKKFISVDVLLVAALDIHESKTEHDSEFTEFELTVATWKRDPKQFGLRGYEHLFPNHKRVYNELISTKTTSPLYRDYMVKVRPNVYKLTQVGVVIAKALKQKLEESSRG